MSNARSPIFNWPEDADGNPLKLVTTSSMEKIPTAPYANIDIFASVSEFASDAKETIEKNQDIVEEGLKKKRDEIIEEVERDE